MTKTTRRTTWLLGAASAALGWGSMPALAQEAAAVAPATDAAATEQTEAAVAQDVIIITGRRPLAESEAASLEIQRESDTIVSALSADAIGNLPDQNVAFAVGRLPGVSLERDQGQARYVNIRGMPRNWTTITFDGLQVISPEGRDSRLDNIPSAIASQVIVNKAITPDMPGGSVAGNINVITRSGLDYDERTIFGKLGAGYVTLGGGEEIDSNLVYADQFLDGRLGVLLQGSFYTRNMVTDNWETDNYITPLAAKIDQRFPSRHRNKPYRLTRGNESLSANFDYEFNEDHSVFWSNIWTNYNDEELRSQYQFIFNSGTDAAGNLFTSPAFNSGTQFSGTVYGAQISSDTNSLESEEDSHIHTIGGESNLGGWKADWRANYTYTADGVDAPALPTFQSPSTATARPTVVYDFSNPDRTLSLFTTLAPTSSTRAMGPQQFSVDQFSTPLTTISRRGGEAATQAYTLKGDISRDFVVGGLDLEFKTGALYTDRTKKNDQESYTATAAQLTAAGLAVPTQGTFALNKSYLAEFDLGYAFRYHSKDALDAYAADLQRRGIATRNHVADRGAYWKVGEEILAGYAMGKLDFDWGNIVAGARVEQITNTGQAFVTFPARPAVGTTPATLAQTLLVSTESEDTQVYPSVNVNWDINDEMKFRVGFTGSAARPDFDDLRPNFSINDAAQTISGGNPEAQPEKQVGIDAYYEWYMEPEGFLSAGVFYKDITDVLFTQTSTFGLDTLDIPGLDRSNYAFSRLDNAGDGYLQGFEIFYSQTAQSLVDSMDMPQWLGGFGVRASGTWTESEVEIPANATGLATVRTQTLPGTSDETYNLQLTYEKYDLSVRLAYQFRTAWVQGYGNYTTVAGRIVPSGNGDIYWGDDEEIDLSVRYQLNDNLEWFFDGINLGNDPAIRFADSERYPIETEQFGERYLMGLRFNF